MEGKITSLPGEACRRRRLSWQTGQRCPAEPAGVSRGHSTRGWECPEGRAEHGEGRANDELAGRTKTAENPSWELSAGGRGESTGDRRSAEFVFGANRRAIPPTRDGTDGTGGIEAQHDGRLRAGTAEQGSRRNRRHASSGSETLSTGELGPDQAGTADGKL